MADVEKVKNGLGTCSHIGWCEGGNDCPYWNEDAQGKEQFEMCKSLLKDALSVIEEQQGRIDHMLSLLGEADREKERLKEEIELLKAQNRPGFGG